MLLETLLRQVQPVKGFVYESAKWIKGAGANDVGRIVVRVRSRKGSSAICSGCGQRRPVHDSLGDRGFDFVPLWGIAVILRYVMRRVRCKRCGVRVEWVPWIRPASKSPMTLAMEQFLATWAKRLSWQEVARVFQVSWDRVFSAVKAAVEYGLANRDLTGITAIGVDELSRRRGHVYATLVYQIDRGRERLLFMSEDRRETSLRGFCDAMGAQVCAQLRFVCSDMWKPYLNVIRERLGQAVHVLDRFHIMANLSKAIDEVRADEARRLAATGKPVLKGTRWLFLKRMANLNHKQAGMLGELLKLNLRTGRAWALKEAMNVMWTYKHPAWAGRFFDRWCAAVMRSRLEPMKRVARSLRDHRSLLLNWFKAKGEISAAIAEGKNHRAKVRARMAYGYRTFEVMQVALYHELGDLPEPESLHRFA